VVAVELERAMRSLMDADGEKGRRAIKVNSILCSQLHNNLFCSRIIYVAPPTAPGLLTEPAGHQAGTDAMQAEPLRAGSQPATVINGNKP
jgi:hypothetical protein